MRLPPVLATFVFLGIAIAGVIPDGVLDSSVADSRQPPGDTPARPPSHSDGGDPKHHDPHTGSGGRHGANLARDAWAARYKSGLEAFEGYKAHDNVPRAEGPKGDPKKGTPKKGPPKQQPPKSAPPKSGKPQPTKGQQPPKKPGQKPRAFISEEVGQALPADQVSPGTNEADDHVHEHVPRSSKPPVKPLPKPPVQPPPKPPVQPPPKPPARPPQDPKTPSKPPPNRGKKTRDVALEQELADDQHPSELLHGWHGHDGGNPEETGRNVADAHELLGYSGAEA